jgi:hypothetical protein
MICNPFILKCTRIHKRLDGGVTKPLLVTAKDENGKSYKIVLKLRHPDTTDGHFEGTSLACELICAILARFIELNVPDYAVVYLPRELAESFLDEKMRRLIEKNVGKNFGTVFLPSVTTWVPRNAGESFDELNQMEDLVTFNSTIINGDRQLDKTNVLWNGERFFLIDHSCALPVHTQWSNEQIRFSPLFPENSVRAHCTFKELSRHRQNAYNFLYYTKLLTIWQKNISTDTLNNIRDLIPSSWEKNCGDLDKIFNFLEARPTRFADISDNLRRIIR